MQGVVYRWRGCFRSRTKSKPFCLSCSPPCRTACYPQRKSCWCWQWYRGFEVWQPREALKKMTKKCFRLLKCRHWRQHDLQHWIAKPETWSLPMHRWKQVGKRTRMRTGKQSPCHGLLQWQQKKKVAELWVGKKQCERWNQSASVGGMHWNTYGGKCANETQHHSSFHRLLEEK